MMHRAYEARRVGVIPQKVASGKFTPGGQHRRALPARSALKSGFISKVELAKSY
jgi:hypothetical protein